jgi:hypothetical protein
VSTRPRSLGDYELLDELGAGAMGTVYRARHVHTGATYAVKTLSSVDVELLARFQREGEGQTRVDDHPHVLRVHSMGREGGTCFLVMDLASGGSLEDRLREGLPAPERAAAWVSDLAAAVEHAHRRGVLHRDLKPANVLFEGDTPLLADFGLAKLLDARSLTQTGSVLGTPAYMAPEQITGERPRLGPRADVYGLGALLYHCLTGRPPFGGTSALDSMRRALDDPPTPPRELRPEIPRALEAVCLRALAKDPADRYPTAAALGAALAEASAGAPTRAAASPPLAALLGVAAAIATGGALALRTGPAPVASPAATAPAETSSPAPSQPAELAAPEPPLVQARDHERRTRRCPGFHELLVDAAKDLRRLGHVEDARVMLEGVLCGAPCQAQAKAFRELGASHGAPGHEDAERAERYLLLALLGGDHKACWLLTGLWMPPELRPPMPDPALRRPHDPDSAAATLWLADHWSDGPQYEGALETVRRRQAVPANEQEALATIFAQRARPPEPETPPTPSRPHPIWGRAPTSEAAEAYGTFRPLRDRLRGLTDERLAELEELLEVVVRTPPSRLHRGAINNLAVIRYGRSNQRAHEETAVGLAHATLLGDQGAALMLGFQYYPEDIPLNSRFLVREPNESLALALFSLANAWAPDDDRGGVEHALREVTQTHGHALPDPEEAYRRVWEAFPDSR